MPCSVVTPARSMSRMTGRTFAACWSALARLTAPEIEELARFDDHWRVILDADDALLVQSLAKRDDLDVLKRRVPLYRLSDLGREALQL